MKLSTSTWSRLLVEVLRFRDGGSSTGRSVCPCAPVWSVLTHLLGRPHGFCQGADQTSVPRVDRGRGGGVGPPIGPVVAHRPGGASCHGGLRVRPRAASGHACARQLVRGRPAAGGQ